MKASLVATLLTPISGTVVILMLGCASGELRAQSATTLPDNRAESLANKSANRARERALALVREMTLVEKIGQMRQLNSISGAVTGTDQNVPDRDSLETLVRQGQVGSILNDVDAESINRLQRIAVEESRLGVPLIFGRDVIHGYRTIFPIPLGQAATWNPQLVENAATVAAREARSAGIHWTFAPMVDISRDPRWGRVAESLGEDPQLASALAAAMVRGLQGDDLSAPDRVAACVKHFAAYGAGEGGRDYNSAVVSPSLMRNVYLKPFKAAVDQGVASLMTSFNDVNGVPGTANRHLLRNVLRKEWGFEGFVVSDWESVHEMVMHGFCETDQDAAKLAVEAGVNIEMVSESYGEHLAKLVKKGAISESAIDVLVTEVLAVKIRLGLFENPYVSSSPNVQLTQEHLEVAQELAKQSIVLLKNDNKLLPLDRSKLKRIAVIGPLADSKEAQLGTWSMDGRPEDSRTPLAAVRETARDGVQVTYSAGLPNALYSSTEGFDEAVAAGRDADVVILCVGETADISGEARSRAVLDLPGAQRSLVNAIAKTGKPIVMIVQAGRPLTIGKDVEKVGAVLYSFHAGTMAGPAIADLLWGVDSPSGKLPLTFPKTVGQIPLYYNHTNTGRPAPAYDLERDGRFVEQIRRDLGYTSNYIDVSPYPLYPFGYGLSYTNFEYGPVELSTKQIRADQRVEIRVPVTNTGEVTGDEVVQLYIRDVVGSLVRPVRELKKFTRVALSTGETKTVKFYLTSEDLAYYDNTEQKVIEPGKFEIYVGGSSLASLAGELKLIR
jgi:beta-glucosidase